MANLGATTTSRAVDRRKKEMSDVCGEYVEKCLILHLDKALVLIIIMFMFKSSYEYVLGSTYDANPC